MTLTNISERQAAAAGRAERDQLEPLRVGDGAWVTASTSTAGIGYRQTMTDDGRILCSCPGGAMECKHKAAVRKLLETERLGGARMSWAERRAEDGTTPAERAPVTIAEEWWIERQGRRFPRYAGVLDAATRSGLVSVAATLTQVGTDDNGQTWIASAVAKFGDGRTFTDVGIATPASVGRAMLPHLGSLAATRAKGRALRDAINVGVATAEELGDQIAEELDDAGRGIRAERDAGRAEVRRVAAAEAAAEAPRAPAEKEAGRAWVDPTPAQLRAIRAIGHDLGLADDKLEEVAFTRFGALVDQLHRADASALIDELKRLRADRAT